MTLANNILKLGREMNAAKNTVFFAEESIHCLTKILFLKLSNILVNYLTSAKMFKASKHLLFQSQQYKY